MNKLLVVLLLLLAWKPISIQFADAIIPENKEIKIPEELLMPDFTELYHEMNLEKIVGLKAFQQAMEGYWKIKPKNKEVITLIDYSKSTKEKRLFVLDINEKKILYASHVLHGRNSGYERPTSFSNDVGSNKSSQGFFITENTYKGKFGYSLRINGLEKGINHRAKDRAIVFHGSKYANPKVIQKAKRLPRSLGCPAIPAELNKEIIDTIKNGTLVYIYADDESYVNKSNLLTSDMYVS